MLDIAEFKQRLRQKLLELRIPAESVEVYGRYDVHIMITCRGRGSAEKWARVLARFCTSVRGPWEAADENKKNKNTVLLPSRHRVWRVWGII